MILAEKDLFMTEKNKEKERNKIKKSYKKAAECVLCTSTGSRVVALVIKGHLSVVL